MVLALGLLLVGIALLGAWTLDEYVSRRRDRCTAMLGMMVGMVAGMTTGLVIGEVAGFFTNMFWSNLLALLLAVPLGGYLGRHGRVLGILDGAMAGIMGGMMGAMLGVMLQFSTEYALVTGMVLVAMQLVALVSVARILEWGNGPVVVREPPGADASAVEPVILPDYYAALGVAPDAMRRDVAAAYLALTDPTAPTLSAEQERVIHDALCTLSDPTCRAAYDRAHASASVAQHASPPLRSNGGNLNSEAVPAGSKLPTEVGRERFVGWGGTLLIGFAIVAFGLVAARPATAACPPPAVAEGLPLLPSVSGEAPGDARPSDGMALAQSGEPQMVNLTIQYPCYYPDRITVQRGVPVRLNVGTVGEPGCGRQVVVRGLGVNGIVPPGKIATFEFTPEQAGTYSINCGMSMMRPASLQVTE